MTTQLRSEPGDTTPLRTSTRTTNICGMVRGTVRSNRKTQMRSVLFPRTVLQFPLSGCSIEHEVYLTLLLQLSVVVVVTQCHTIRAMPIAKSSLFRPALFPA